MDFWCCLHSGNVLAAGGGIKAVDMKFAEPPKKFGLGSVQDRRLLLFPWLVCTCPDRPARDTAMRRQSAESQVMG